jgi:hypothetical protein
MYGGFFSLDSAAGSTSGAALYATNSTVAANILDLQDNTTSVFTVGDGGVTIAKSNSTSGFQIQDSASSKAVLTVDTSGDQVLLGKAGASGLNGKLVFNNGTDSSTAAITFTGNSTASYTYQLPTGTVSSNSCLQSGTVSSGVVPLSFGSCGSGGTSLSVNGASVGSTANLQNTTGTNSTAGNTFTNTSGNVTLAIDSATGSLAGVVTATGTQTFGGSKVFSGTTLFSNTAQVQKTSTSSLQVQTDSGSTDLLTADTSNMHININSTFTALGTGFGTLSVTDAGAGSLTSGSQYYYVVTAIDSAGGETTASTEGTLGTGHTALTVSWTTITGASGYRIYRATTTGGETYYTTVFTNSFTDTGQYTAGTTTASGTNTARSATNNSNSALQLSIGANGSPTGQLYVSGVVPSSFTGRTTDGLSGPNRIFVQGRYAYVASESNHSLVIYDVSNPAAPQKISSTASPFTDPQDVYVQGKYAYICDFTNNAIYIFDVSNPASPTQVGAATTGLSAPQSVYVQGHYAYVASSTNSTLAIFDVSNPASPVPASTITTNLSTPVRVYVQGNYAYVANQGTSTSAIFDVSNPASPSAAGTFNIGGGNANRYVVVQGRYAYSVGTNASNKGVFTINDVSNPGVGVSSPVVKTILGTDNNDFNQPVRISVQGRYAYIASRGDCSLVVFDISTPSSPKKVGSVSSGMVPGGAGCTVGGSDGPRGLFVLGRYAYLTANTANAFAIYDMGGTYTQQLEAGGAEVGSLQVDSNAQVAGDFSIQGGAAVGQSLQVTGSISSGSGGVTIASTGNTGSVTLSQASTTSNVSLVLPSSLPGASNYCIVSTNLGVLSFSACGAGSTRTVTLSPEYPGAVMTANNTTGNTHTGTMTSDFCSGSSHLGIPASSNPCGATEEHNYYSWTANATNDYDIFVRWQAPSDFSSLSSINFYGWKNGATDDVKLTIYSSTGSVCGTATSISGSTSTWINQAYTITGCSPSAGNVLTFDLDLKVAVSSDITRVGEINIVYNRN